MSAAGMRIPRTRLTTSKFPLGAGVRLFSLLRRIESVTWVRMGWIPTSRHHGSGRGGILVGSPLPPLPTP